MVRLPPDADVDEVNRAIITQLQEDGRRPYATIGKAVGLSEAAIRQRVGKMVDSGVIQIVAVTDPAQLGYEREAMVAIRTSGPVDAVAAKLAAIPEVIYLVVIAGGYDLLAEVVVTDDKHLLDLINSSIRSVPGVVSTESFLYLKVAKQTYDWGTR